MPRLYLLNILLLFINVGCKESETALQAPIQVVQPPRYKNIEFFVCLGSPEAQQGGGYMQPNLTGAEKGNTSWGMTYTPENIAANKYELSASYEGRVGDSDQYKVELIFPTETGRNSRVIPIKYEGRMLIFHKDHRKGGYVVGIRPFLEK